MLNGGRARRQRQKVELCLTPTSFLQPGVAVGRTSVVRPPPDEVPDEGDHGKADKHDRGVCAVSVRAK